MNLKTREDILREMSLAEILAPFERMDKEIHSAVESDKRIALLEASCNGIWKAIPGMTTVTCSQYGDGVNFRVTAGTEAGAWEIIHKGNNPEALWTAMHTSIFDYARTASQKINAALQEFCPKAPKTKTPGGDDGH